MSDCPSRWVRTFSSAAFRDAICRVAAFRDFVLSASCVVRDNAASSAFSTRCSAASLSKLAACVSHTGYDRRHMSGWASAYVYGDFVAGS